jgi:hypothetical protein
MNRSVASSLLVVVVLLLTVRSVAAQFTRGSIYGTVTDANGLVVPGVTVTLTSPALLRPEVAVSNESGAYRFPTLEPGEYALTAELTGFRTFQQPGIAIAGGSNTRVDAVLQIAELAETVMVTGTTSDVNLKSNTVQVAYDEKKLQELPSARDVWSIMESMPGVVTRDVNVGGSGADSRGNQVYAYGSMGSENTYHLNGVIMTDPAGAAGGESYVPYDEDSFSEMRIETGAKSPEIAGQGVYISMTTKSGGNTLSGGASFFGQDSSFNADNISDELRQRGVVSSNAVLNNTDFSGRLGGPIMKNRVWFFGSARVRRVETAVLNFYMPDGSLGSNIEKPSSYAGKISTQLPRSNRVEFFYNWSRRLAPYRGASPNTTIEATNLEDTINNVYQGTLTKVFGDRAFLDVRGGTFFADFAMFDSQFIGPDPVRRQELTTNVSSGGPGQLRHHFRTRYRVDSALTWYVQDFHGAHEIRGGVQWEDGGQEVDQTVHDDVWLMFNNGVPSRVRIWNSPTHYNDRYQDLGLHINDTWTVSRRVTISAGVRVSNAEAYYPEQTNRQNREEEPWENRPGIYFPDEVRLPETRDILNWRNPAPRVSLTIDPQGNTRSAIRVSYGRYYTLLNSKFADVINPNLARFVTLGWNDVNKDGQPQDSELDRAALLDFSSPTGTGVIGDKIDSSSVQPLEDQVAIGYDRQIGQRGSVGVTYHDHRSTRGMGFENELVPFSAYIPLTINNPIGAGTFGIFDLPASLRGVSQRLLTNQDNLTRSYKGVEFRVQRRFASRWQASGSVTVGKAEGIAVDNLSSDNQDPNLLINRYGADPRDAAVIGKISGSYTFPFDIMASVNYRFDSGRAFTPTLRITGLNQGDVTINTEVPGTTRYDKQNLLDVRLDKRFRFASKADVHLVLDTFNLLNVNAVLGMNALSGTLNKNTSVFATSSTYRQITSVMPPRTMLLGAKFTF